jgi:hypothetical protein
MGCCLENRARTCARSDESFFPLLARLRVALRVLGVGRELAPAVACQHAVHPGQGNAVAQVGLNFLFQFRDDQHRALGGAGQRRVQRCRFGLQRALGPVAQLCLVATRRPQSAGAGAKVSAQGAGGELGAAQHKSSLRQSQSSLQRQQNGQRDAQLIGRAGLVACLARCFDTALSCERSGHGCSSIQSKYYR